MKNTLRRVTIVVPTYNEEKHIAQTLRQLSRDEGFADFEVIVCDGNSTDGTAAAADALGYPNLKVVQNPKRSQASAVNLAAGLVRERAPDQMAYLVRADAHSIYPVNFVTSLIHTAETRGADSVVVPMHTVEGNSIQQAAHILFNSWLGNGGAAHRSQSVGQWVDHGHHALFRLEAFLDAGGYDETFIANEDAELDHRLTSAGYRIYLDGSTPIGYIPRDSLAGTWKQMRRNGFYRMKNLAKHGVAPKLRQLLPVLVMPFLVGVLLLSLLISPLFLVLALAYFVPVGLLAWRDCGRLGAASLKLRFTTFLLAVTTHTGFSSGAAEFAVAHCRTLLSARTGAAR